MRRVLVLILPLLLAACLPETEAETPPLPLVGPERVAAEKAACEAQGGRWGQGGLAGRFTCFRPTEDAGKSCRAADECSTMCLARSQSCAPITPLFGCHDILDSQGRLVGLCID